MSNAAILGRIGISLEGTTNPGETLVLASTAVSALPASLTTALSAITGASAYVGWRLLIVVSGNSATGTITVAGKDFSQALNAISEATPTIAIAGSASNPLTTGYEYLTSNIYSSVNSSGVTVSGLTGGSVKIYALASARSLQPCMFDAEEKKAMFSPQEQRGLVSLHTNIQRLNKVVDIATFKEVLYPDTAAWWFGRAIIGSSPAQVTVPSTPTVLKASHTPTGSVSLTTQPNTVALGEILKFVISGGTTAVGTIAVAGTDAYTGLAISETVQAGAPGAASGDGTYYTQQCFATVNSSGVTYTGLTGGTPLCAISGYYLLKETYTAASSASSSTAGDTLNSVAVDWFDGTDFVSLPYSQITELMLEGSAEKEILLTGKGMAQDMLAIGNRTTTPLSATALAYAPAIGAPGAFSTSGGSAAGLWQPLDYGGSGWQVQWYADALSGTAGTTALNTVLTWKITCKTPFKASYPSVLWDRFQKLYRQQREFTIDLTVDLQDMVQYENYRQNIPQLVQLYIQGPPTGAGGSFRSWTFTFVVRTTQFKRDASKMEKVEATLQMQAYYQLNAFGAGVHGELQYVAATQLPANYAS